MPATCLFLDLWVQSNRSPTQAVRAQESMNISGQRTPPPPPPPPPPHPQVEWSQGFIDARMNPTQPMQRWCAVVGLCRLLSIVFWNLEPTKPRRLRQAIEDETAAWIIRHLKAICFSFGPSPSLVQQAVRPLTHGPGGSREERGRLKALAPPNGSLMCP